MIKQQLFRLDERGSRTVASSPGMKNSAWLRLLEQQLELVDVSMMSVPTFYQYPLGRGLVLSRCVPDPSGKEKSYLAHQLVIDEPDDLQALMDVRPLSTRSFFAGGFDTGVSPNTLPMMPISSLDNEGALDACFETLDVYFGGREELLGNLIGALTLCARDKRQSIRAVIEDRPETVSESGRRLMELLLCALKRVDALRVSFSTLQMTKSMEMNYTICFSPLDDPKPTAHDIIFNLTEGEMRLPAGLTLPDPERCLEIARMLLLHDVNRVVMFRGGVQEACSTPEALRLTMRPFDKGMSLTEYVESWRAALELRRPLLSERGFRRLVGGEWSKLLGVIIEASEQMENLPFLIQFHEIICRVYREREESLLTPDEETLTDMVVLLLDSIRWKELDLSNTKTWRLIRTITGYAPMLTGEEYTDEASINACRIIHQMMMNPSSAREILIDLSLLEEDSASCFEALQDCLKRYVQSRLDAEFDVADEMLAAAAMLGLVKFSEGVPDLRLVDKLTKRIEEKHGAQDAHRFEEIIEKMRRHLHAAGRFHRREVKGLLTVSCLILALIAVISIWFFWAN